MLHAPQPTAESLAEPMRSRWSPSIFDDEHQLRTDQVETLLRAAQWAPSWGNTQPWRLLVAVRGDRAHRALVPHLSRGNSGWVPRASVVFVTGTQVGPDETGDELKGLPYACHDLGQAAAHLTLQARAMGLHAHQFAGCDWPAVARELVVPDHFRLLTGIAVGMRGNPEDVSERDRERELRERRRRPLAETAFEGEWGRPWSAE